MVSFLELKVYHLKDPHDEQYERRECEWLVEPELEGRYQKWNDNRGHVLDGQVPRQQPLQMGAIAEEEEWIDDESSAEDIDSIPQALSHFSYFITRGSSILVDLQGIWNATDGFTLTVSRSSDLLPKRTK